MFRIVHAVPVIAEVVQLALQSGIQPATGGPVVSQGPDHLFGSLWIVPEDLPVSLEPCAAGGAVVGEDVLGGRGEVLRCMPEIDQLERLWNQGGQEAPIVCGRVCDGNKPQIGPEPGGMHKFRRPDIALFSRAACGLNYRLN